MNSDPSSRELRIDETLDGNLKGVLRRACSARVAERFHSADEFIGALLSLQLKAIPLPEPPMDAKAKMDEVMVEVIAERWDEALRLCPPEWIPLRDQILRRKERAELIAEAQPLLSHGGFDLRFISTDNFESAQGVDKETAGPGIVRIYRVSGPDGQVLDVGYFISDCGRRWVGVTDVYETLNPLKRLGQGLRLGIKDHGEQLVAELRQARIKNKDLWSSCFKASEEELDAGAGLRTNDVFRVHGATGYGTKAEILGDAGKNKNYLCATFASEAEDLPAVLYFVTRVLPLARGVRAQ